MSAEAVTQYMSLFDTLIEGETPEPGCSYQRYVNTKEYLSYVAETIRHFGYTRSSDEGISTATRALDFYDVTVAQGDSKKAVVITSAITVVNAMGKLYETVTVA